MQPSKLKQQISIKHESIQNQNSLWMNILVPVPLLLRLNVFWGDFVDNKEYISNR